MRIRGGVRACDWELFVFSAGESEPPCSGSFNETHKQSTRLSDETAEAFPIGCCVHSYRCFCFKKQMCSEIHWRTA